MSAESGRSLSELIDEFTVEVERAREGERQRILDGRNLTSRDLRILRILHDSEKEPAVGGRVPDGLSFSEIVDRLEVAEQNRANRSTVSQALTRMGREHQLFDRDRRDPDDLRQPIIKLNSVGKELASQLCDAERSILPRFISTMNLDPQQATMLESVLKQGIDRAHGLRQLRPKVHAPNIARVYDFLLGGSHHYGVDRDLARRILTEVPYAIDAACANRVFLYRAISFLASNGVTQFIDIGAGLPTAFNTHQVAQSHLQAARVIYVDSDPTVVEESNLLLASDDNAAAIQGDVRDPTSFMFAPEMKRLDFSKPIGVILAAVLHFVTDDDVAIRAIRSIREAIHPGSFIAISHGTKSAKTNEKIERVTAIYRERVAETRIRTKDEIGRFFEGLEIVKPGLVFAPQWHTEIPAEDIAGRAPPCEAIPEDSMVLVGVGKVRQRKK